MLHIAPSFFARSDRWPVPETFMKLARLCLPLLLTAGRLFARSLVSEAQEIQSEAPAPCVLRCVHLFRI